MATENDSKQAELKHNHHNIHKKGKKGKKRNAFRRARLRLVPNFGPKGLEKLNVNKIADAVAKTAEDTTIDTSFMDEIWEECVSAGYPNESLTSELWQGMASGNLEPNDFGGFNVQDVAYCANSANGWAKAAVAAQQDGEYDLSSYLISKTVDNLENADYMRQEWGVQPSGVILNDATTLYMKVETYVVETLGPYYCPVANYACYQLWPWLAKNLQSILKPKDTPNVYFDFINDNLEYQSSADKLAHQIGIYAKQGKIEKDTALQIVANCLYCEAYMARSATDQEMTMELPYPKAQSS